MFWFRSSRLDQRRILYALRHTLYTTKNKGKYLTQKVTEQERFRGVIQRPRTMMINIYTYKFLIVHVFDYIKYNYCVKIMEKDFNVLKVYR